MARILILILIPLALIACSDGSSIRTHETIQLGGMEWNMELALDDAAITRGMMGRESFPPGEGMLFVFPDNRIRSFWMANCLIDIDLLFLDGHGFIATTHRMKAEAPRGEEESDLDYQSRLAHYWSSVPVRFAIEVPQGTIDSLKLAPNQKVDLDVEGLKELQRRADRLQGP